MVHLCTISLCLVSAHNSLVETGHMVDWQMRPSPQFDWSSQRYSLIIETMVGRSFLYFLNSNKVINKNSSWGTRETAQQIIASFATP